MLSFVLLVSTLQLAVAFLEARSLYRTRTLARTRFAHPAHQRHAAPPSDQYFTQRLDHFDVTDDTTWQQRFWSNSVHWNGTGPVFAYVCGEAAGSPYSVLEGQHFDLGLPYGALFLALEHRYYGVSIPAALPDLSTASLRYLSSHQAIADIATFLVEGAAVQFGFDPGSTRVAVFGGSYPGVLAAQATLRLPHLIDFAVASSAPVASQVDYWGYNDVVGHSLANTAVGGSPACAGAVSDAFATMAQAFAGTPDERHAMAAKLGNCAGLDGVNDTAFAVSEYSNILKGIVQGNDQWWMPYSIQQICGNMTQPGVQPIDALAGWLSTWLASSNSGRCYSTSYTAEVEYVSNTTKSAWSSDQYRQWLWQLCSQFGQAQTCDAGSDCPFSSLYPDAASNLQTCTDVFGPSITPNLVANRVAFTNDYMGGRSLRARRVVYVNGEIDPWHAAGRWNITNDADQPTVFIPGASHCRDMISASPQDPPAVQAAHAQIRALVDQYMAVP